MVFQESTSNEGLSRKMHRDWVFSVPLLSSCQLPNTESTAALFEANIKLPILAMWDSCPLIQINLIRRRYWALNFGMNKQFRYKANAFFCPSPLEDLNWSSLNLHLLVYKLSLSKVVINFPLHRFCKCESAPHPRTDPIHPKNRKTHNMTISQSNPRPQWFRWRENRPITLYEALHVRQEKPILIYWSCARF